MIIEEHIEELRAELRDAIDPAERQKIELELEHAKAELGTIIAERDRCQVSETPD